MNKTQPVQCQNSLRQNIPWYLNGTLSDTDAALVRQHIDGCADCRFDLELHSSMRSAVLGHDVTPIMPRTRSHDISGIGKAGISRPAGSGLSASQWFAVAAGLAITCVAVLFYLYPVTRNEATNKMFETATSAGSSGDIGYVLQVRFEDHLSDAERNAIATRLQGAVRWIVSDNGVYEVHVQLAMPSLQILEDYEQRTGSLPGVQSAEFTALQLPMR